MSTDSTKKNLLLVLSPPKSHHRSRSSDIERREEHQCQQYGQENVPKVELTQQHQRKRGESAPLLLLDKVAEFVKEMENGRKAGDSWHADQHSPFLASSTDGTGLPMTSRPNMAFDFRRPSLPNSILALEMLRSMGCTDQAVAGRSPSQPGSCTSLLKTLTEESGEVAEMILQSDRGHHLLLSTAGSGHFQRAPSPVSPLMGGGKFVRRRAAPIRRGSNNSSNGAEQWHKAGVSECKQQKQQMSTSNTDLRALEQQQCAKRRKSALLGDGLVTEQKSLRQGLRFWNRGKRSEQRRPSPATRRCSSTAVMGQWTTGCPSGEGEAKANGKWDAFILRIANRPNKWLP